MENEIRFTNEKLKKKHGLNYRFVTGVANVLNLLKYFEVGYRNPEKGKMIVKYGDDYYLVDVEPIDVPEGDTFTKVLNDRDYLFR